MYNVCTATYGTSYDLHLSPDVLTAYLRGSYSTLATLQLLICRMTYDLLFATCGFLKAAHYLQDRV